jgi:hypothetical protein
MPPRAAGIYRDSVALSLEDSRHDAADVRARNQGVQHVMTILAGMPLQCAERKFKAEGLQRLLPTANRQRRAIDQCPLHVEDYKRTSDRHGNCLGSKLGLAARRHATTGELARRPREHSYASAASRIVTNAVRRQDVPD